VSPLRLICFCVVGYSPNMSVASSIKNDLISSSETGGIINSTDSV